MKTNPPPARLARIAGMIRQQLQVMQTRRLAKIAGHTDMIVDGLERLVKLRSAQAKAVARNWHTAARKMVRQTAVALRDLPRYITDAQRNIQASQASVPSLRELYSEMIQLRQEFDGISCSRSRSEQHLSVTTEPIELHGVYLGEFEIVLDIDRLARECGSDTFIVRALDPHPAASNRGVTHPHVSDEQICPGDASAAIRGALCNGRICDAFLMMRSVLLVYNSGSPHVSLDSWGGTPCYECGYTVSESNAHWCEACEENFCDECSTCCDQCSKTVCSGCSATCPACQEIACRSCMTVCDDCGEPICLNCQKDGECPCHDENHEQENQSDEQEEKADQGAVLAAGANVA
jgi:hypothetical protein